MSKHNGKDCRPDRGDPGKLLDDGSHNRSDLQMVERAIRQGWILPDIMATLPKRVAEIALKAEQDERAVTRAAQVLCQMHRANIEAATILDKIKRLDSGQATERVEHFEAEFDRMG